MNRVEFGFDRLRGYGSARGQFWPIAIDGPTRRYNIAGTTIQQAIPLLHFALPGGRHCDGSLYTLKFVFVPITTYQ
jgi:hypothetical protein